MSGTAERERGRRVQSRGYHRTTLPARLLLDLSNKKRRSEPPRIYLSLALPHRRPYRVYLGISQRQNSKCRPVRHLTEPGLADTGRLFFGVLDARMDTKREPRWP